MHISLETLRNSPGQTYFYEFIREAAAFDLTEDGACFDRPVEVRLEAVFRDGKFHVFGSMLTALISECSRCLQPFTFRLEGQWEDDLPAEEVQDLDVIRLARELYYAALPLKPLCAEVCKGLCSVCGADRNHENCGCDLEQMHDKLSVLKKLLLEQDEEV
ncbi:MAG: YceD family protein [Dethiobacter sp.]